MAQLLFTPLYRLNPKDNQLMLSMVKGDGPKGEECEVAETGIDSNIMYLRVTVNEGGRCIFSYSLDGEDFIKIGDEFIAKKGRWIGAKVGIFCNNYQYKNSNGFADFDWFLLEEMCITGAKSSNMEN